eukprot:scaffold249703_cov19-Tisochrysis_lutea.AAC.1
MPGLLERERRNKVVLALCNNPRCSQVFVQARAVGGRMQEQGCAGALQSSQVQSDVCASQGCRSEYAGTSLHECLAGIPNA